LFCICCVALQDVSEHAVFQAVAAWCQYGSQQTVDMQQQQAPAQAQEHTPHLQQQQQQLGVLQQCTGDELCMCDMTQPGAAGSLARPAADVQELLQLVRFGFMPEADRQVCAAVLRRKSWFAGKLAVTMCLSSVVFAAPDKLHVG
jgi:hypothetical protein